MLCLVFSHDLSSVRNELPGAGWERAGGKTLEKESKPTGLSKVKGLGCASRGTGKGPDLEVGVCLALTWPHSAVTGVNPASRSHASPGSLRARRRQWLSGSCTGHRVLVLKYPRLKRRWSHPPKARALCRAVPRRCPVSVRRSPARSGFGCPLSAPHQPRLGTNTMKPTFWFLHCLLASSASCLSYSRKNRPKRPGYTYCECSLVWFICRIPIIYLTSVVQTKDAF